MAGIINSDMNRMTSGWPFGAINQENWILEKEERLTCFGYPGYIDQWQYWSSYKTREEAEQALAKLNSRRDPTKRERYQIRDRREDLWVLK